VRDGISDGHCWIIRNILFSDGESIVLGDVSLVFGSPPKIPEEAIRLENLERMVWWKEERARVADQIPVVQAKSHILTGMKAFRNGMIRISRNLQLWRGEPVIPRTHWEFTLTDGKKELDGGCVKFQGKEKLIPKGRHTIDWRQLSHEDWHCIGGEIIARGAGGHESDDEDDYTSGHYSGYALGDTSDAGKDDGWTES
jgi:hypothetical protein